LCEAPEGPFRQKVPATFSPMRARLTTREGMFLWFLSRIDEVEVSGELEEKTILLAEDDPAHEELFRRAVEQSPIPCRVEVVHDGVEAIEYLFATGAYGTRDPHDMPDLIVLDLKMPRMDGLQVLQVLRRVRGTDQTRFAPLVVLSCSENDHDITEAYRRGAQSYIPKPQDYPQFARAVCETLEYWLGLNRPVPRARAWEYMHEGL